MGGKHPIEAWLRILSLVWLRLKCSILTTSLFSSIEFIVRILISRPRQCIPKFCILADFRHKSQEVNNAEGPDYVFC